MQARLELIRFPAAFFAIVFALAAALSLGAVLGYTLKPSTLAPTGTQVIVVHERVGCIHGLARCFVRRSARIEDGIVECQQRSAI